MKKLFAEAYFTHSPNNRFSEINLRMSIFLLTTQYYLKDYVTHEQPSENQQKPV